MKNIGFLIEDDFHKEIKIQSTNKDKTIKDYIIDLIKEDLAKQKEQSTI